MTEVVEDFTLVAQDNSEFNLYDALDNTENGIVIFVYPKANTPACTKQAVAFRDKYEDFKKLGYEVVGISKGAPATHAKWKDTKDLPFDLLSDEDGELLKSFGCINGNSSTVQRSVFVLDKKTKTFSLERVKVGPEDAVVVAMAAITGDTANDDTSEEEDVENQPPPPKAAKPKGKAKAKATSRGRAAGNVTTAEQRKASDNKRTGSTKGTQDDDAATENKKPPLARKAVKRAEPSGVDCSENEAPKVTKKQKKVADETTRASSQQPERRVSTRKTAAGTNKGKEEPKAAAKKGARSASATRAKGKK